MINLLIILLFPAFAFAAPRQYGRFYIAGPPTSDELVEYQKHQGDLVVDLRTPPEIGEEPSKVAKLGLKYTQVSYDAQAEAIDPNVIAGIDKVVKSADEKPVFLFCRSGNRAASYLAIHLVRDKKIPLEDAIRAAKDLGMSGPMESKVRSYLAARVSH